MANALTVRRDQLPSSQKAKRAAQYVRMSTDRQRYSIQNQAAAIAAYAHAHDLKIVRTYADEGESGLRIKNRAGLRQLIQDITSGEAHYAYLLVYDVSRWGRFQDIDESAHYEFICRRAGVKVQYCAEQFDNDGSVLSSIVKNLKRVMAAEYSRELSVKIHAAQSRIVRLGFRHGAQIGYGLRRELVDEDQQSKGFLKKGDVKALQSDRVKARLGPASEIATVRWIFDQCLEGRSDARIARELNAHKVPTTTGRVWNRNLVCVILRNETYIGNIVYNRWSRKLKGARVSNPPELWVRGERWC
jgi:DNA invertase Pin-like site-specific DNA recombinase